MKIIFSDHSEIKIKQRELSKELISKTVIAPDFIIPSYNNLERAYKQFGKLYLEVIFVKEEEILIIITAHWVEKFKKLS